MKYIFGNMFQNIEKKDDWSDRFKNVLSKDKHERQREHVENLTQTPNTFRSRLDNRVKSEEKKSNGSMSPVKESRVEKYRFDEGRVVCNTCDQHIGSNSEERVNTIIKILFNSIIGFVMLSVLIALSYIIFDDVTNKLNSEIQFEAARINQCQKDYEENNCESNKRLPALEEYCQEKDKCRFENPRSVVMKSTAITVLVAEVINGFINTLEVKSLIVLFSFIFGLILTFNCSLGYCSKRRKYENEMHHLRKELFSKYEPRHSLKCKHD